MTFDQIPAGVAVFLDANSLVYHFTDADFDRVPWLARYEPI